MNKTWKQDEIDRLIATIKPHVEQTGFVVTEAKPAIESGYRLSLTMKPQGLGPDILNERTTTLCLWLRSIWGKPDAQKAEFNPFREGAPPPEMRRVVVQAGAGLNRNIVRGDPAGYARAVVGEAPAPQGVFFDENEPIRGDQVGGRMFGVDAPPIAENGRLDAGWADPPPTKKASSKDLFRFKYTFQRADGGLIYTYIY